MAPYFWLNSLSPGNEQANYWGSAAAGQHGTRNYPGIRSKAVDAMIAAILSARSRDDLVTAARALDRVLISGFYVVPLYHLPDQWIAHWSYIKRPKTTSLYGALPQTWWRESGH
jgi:peptide/nickel transport system substrate-binding protein